jgi:hypothetical protein
MLKEVFLKCFLCNVLSKNGLAHKGWREDKRANVSILSPPDMIFKFLHLTHTNRLTPQTLCAKPKQR